MEGLGFLVNEGQKVDSFMAGKFQHGVDATRRQRVRSQGWVFEGVPHVLHEHCFAGRDTSFNHVLRYLAAVVLLTSSLEAGAFALGNEVLEGGDGDFVFGIVGSAEVLVIPDGKFFVAFEGGQLFGESGNELSHCGVPSIEPGDFSKVLELTICKFDRQVVGAKHADEGAGNAKATCDQGEFVGGKFHALDLLIVLFGGCAGIALGLGVARFVFWLREKPNV